MVKLSFINDVQIYTIAENNFVVQRGKWYEFAKNSLWLRIVYNKKWNEYLLDITHQFTYTKDGESKEDSCITYFNLTAAKTLVYQFPLAYQLAINLQNNHGVEIYNLFCLISEIFYTFPHRSGASYRKRLGR